MIRVGINGFGRIGRALTRIASTMEDLKIVAINDIDEDKKNLAYLLKYDSIYGQFEKDIVLKKKKLSVNNNSIKLYTLDKIEKVPWSKDKIDILIDATGLSRNIKKSKSILRSGVKKVLLTHSPNSGPDFYMVLGANENKYNSKKHNIISTSICDASALSPILKEIDEKYKIENGFITTLHSILSYQNLLDGSLKSVSNPTHKWKDYSLGRNSTLSLIPKNTTSVSAVEKILPNIKNKLSGISFRVPTNIVCGSDISIKVRKNLNVKELKTFLKNLSKNNKNIYKYEEEKLVSIDHLGTTKSLVIDSNYLNVLQSKYIKIIIWYDNEWGYSNRVLDIAKKILK